MRLFWGFIEVEFCLMGFGGRILLRDGWWMLSREVEWIGLEWILHLNYPILNL